ncbi:Fis family transcriptional regulator, factor for inversion stimulation protein [Oceanospirillum multiglobuliferum]|uniref:Putative Fis-like DNA-binding protein n=1 Tax=Oceanospirillum multiglobuliferum TaxID=64969 RepID=A0A1T4KW60_9GAMM|nr:DNA-binding transcriptional regulator Fis [Oceanospirillum multiglobuliferum]OPX54977.1 Fis family transcriptional regulator [Oceanospirillum multiglobuliferum]SJZ46665.1 Fis family transcriptional regulator, factor for inversion stimulation protein [Oceanospirillum multiglobuliferum]
MTENNLINNLATASPHSDVADGVSTTKPETLRHSVEVALNNYFTHLEGQPVTDLYQMVLSEIEAPLLEAVMRHTGDNQSQASEMLGLNRGTLRKKLKQYGLL